MRSPVKINVGESGKITLVAIMLQTNFARYKKTGGRCVLKCASQ
jgi:hypothetical protein